MRQIAAFRHRRILCAGAVCLVLSTTPAPALAAAEQAASLKIVVLEGEDSVNLIDKKTAVKPTVEVRDRNDLPVAGALVRFAINGRGAAFNNGVRQLTVTTDSLGRATVNSITPISKGTVEIQVQASYQGQTAAATIHQANFANAAQAAQAGKVPSQAGQSASSGPGSAGAGAATAGAGAGAAGGLSGAAIAGIVGGAAAAVGAGVAVANRGSSNDTTTTSPGLNLTGTWNGSITGTQANGSVVLRLTQAANSLTGTDLVPFQPFPGQVFNFTSNIAGSVSGSSVTMTETDALSISATSSGVTVTITCNYTIVYTLTAPSSSAMSGSWTETSACSSNVPAVLPPFSGTDGGRVTLTKQ